jgi:hypothetical protein
MMTTDSQMQSDDKKGHMVFASWAKQFFFLTNSINKDDDNRQTDPKSKAHMLFGQLS